MLLKVSDPDHDYLLKCDPLVTNAVINVQSPILLDFESHIKESYACLKLHSQCFGLASSYITTMQSQRVVSSS